MSALRHKPPFGVSRSNFRFTPECRLNSEIRHVRKVPTADSCTVAKARLIDRLVGGEQRRRHIAPECPGGLQQRNFCSCSGTPLFGLRQGRTCSSLRAPGLGRFRKQSIFEPGGRSARMPAAFFRRLLEITMQPCRSRCDLRAHRGARCWACLIRKETGR
jgi:hypothetical protein